MSVGRGWSRGGGRGSLGELHGHGVRLRLTVPALLTTLVIVATSCTAPVRGVPQVASSAPRGSVDTADAGLAGGSGPGHEPIDRQTPVEYFRASSVGWRDPHRLFEWSPDPERVEVWTDTTSQDEPAYAWVRVDRDGRVVSSYPLGNARAPMLADLDGDGHDELISWVRTSGSPEPPVVAWSLDPGRDVGAVPGAGSAARPSRVRALLR